MRTCKKYPVDFNVLTKNYPVFLRHPFPLNFPAGP